MPQTNMNDRWAREANRRHEPTKPQPLAPAKAAGKPGFKLSELALTAADRAKLQPPIVMKTMDAAHLAGVKVMFVEIDPALAKQWLAKNTGNRKLKEDTADALARDMRNGEFLTTHQGIAFDDKDRLIDGQHRLEAIVRSGVTVTLMVSTGWPSQPKGKKTRTMDAVDAGAARSLSDRLKLQHNIENGGMIVKTCTVLAHMCVENPRHVGKLTMPALLAIVDVYHDEIKFAVENAPTTKGLRQAAVLGAMAFLHAVHPAVEVYGRLRTGENLAATNPLLALRNYLMSDAAKKRTNNGKNDRLWVVRVIIHHATMFLEHKSHGQENVVHSQAALAALKAAQKEKVAKVARLFAVTAPVR